jgi:hypothetical protein
MSGGDVMVLIAVTGQFLLAGVIVTAIATRIQQKAALRAQLEMKLIERFSTARELEEFLGTEAGRLLLGGHRRPGGSHLGKIVGVVQGGIILLALGLGMLAIAAVIGHKAPLGVAILILALGAGLLVAAAVGRRLIRAWGLNGHDTVAAPAREA